MQTQTQEKEIMTLPVTQLGIYYDTVVTTERIVSLYIEPVNRSSISIHQSMPFLKKLFYPKHINYPQNITLDEKIKMCHKHNQVILNKDITKIELTKQQHSVNLIIEHFFYSNNEKIKRQNSYNIYIDVAALLRRKHFSPL